MTLLFQGHECNRLHVFPHIHLYWVKGLGFLSLGVFVVIAESKLLGTQTARQLVED
jgi:hypothetical protein